MIEPTPDLPDLRYLVVDVFTDRRFEGNPLAVVLDPPDLSDEQMLAIAGEFNLSETIFLRAAGDDRWDTRIFTPSQELPFAGHPTVGGAVALGLAGRLSPDADGRARIVLAERSGDVDVEVSLPEAGTPSATFVGPQEPKLVMELDDDDRAVALAALGLGAGDLHDTLPVGVWSAGVPFTVVPVVSTDVLARIRVDPARLGAASAAVEPFLYPIAPGASLGSWRARMFASAAGIAEDPATGGAACAVAGLLATTVADGAHQWVIEQGVEMGRRSLLNLGATVTAGRAGRPTLGGEVVPVAEGVLRV